MVLAIATSVATPYGKGTIVGIRSDGLVIVSPDSWLLAHGKAPIFYLNEKDITPLVNLLESISCI